jgi:hypothetical protein
MRVLSRTQPPAFHYAKVYESGYEKRRVDDLQLVGENLIVDSRTTLDFFVRTAVNMAHHMHWL